MGWLGNPVLQEQRITCATTDPLVAALFGVECRNHGHAVIFMAREDAFSCLISPPNIFETIESAVNLGISPQEFARNAERVLEIDDVLAVLWDLGFKDVPIRIRDLSALQEALLASYSAGDRLTEEQLQSFVTRIRGAGP